MATNSSVHPPGPTTATPADIKEYPKSYESVIDMPGPKSGDIKVLVEEENVLLISGGVRVRKWKVRSTEDGTKSRQIHVAGNSDAIKAVCQDGVLTVTVEKLPPPEPKEPRSIEVQIS